MRKMINIEMARLQALELLASDRKQNLADLLDEAIVDLLKKHRRPVTVREMFEKSVGRGTRKKKTNR